jgi:hypothetical protein
MHRPTSQACAHAQYLDVTLGDAADGDGASRRSDGQGSDLHAISVR